MKKHALTVGFLVSFASLTGACGSDAPGNLYASVDASRASAISEICECFAAFDDFANAAECEADFGDDDSAAEVACIEEVYDTYRAELQANADCQLRVFAAGEACVRRVSMCDGEAILACIDTASTADEACPAVPANIQAAIDACEP